MSSSNNKGVASQPNEDAPLLVNDALKGNKSDDEETINGEQIKQGSSVSWSRRIWQWMRGNLMIIFIALLLIGGFVALCVYFAGTLKSISP